MELPCTRGRTLELPGTLQRVPTPHPARGSFSDVTGPAYRFLGRQSKRLVVAIVRFCNTHAEELVRTKRREATAEAPCTLTTCP
jgi:hypothetical protein